MIYRKIKILLVNKKIRLTTSERVLRSYLVYPKFKWAIKCSKALFSSPKNLKNFQDFPSHRILRHMHGALNTDENKN